MGDCRSVVIAGGKGSRQGLLSDRKPKHFLPVLDRPLIEYQLDALADYESVRISYSRFNEDAFEQYFADRDGTVLRKDDTLKGPLYPLVELADEAVDGDDPVVGLTGDAYTFPDIDDIVAFHEEHDRALTIGLTRSYPSPEACVFHTDGDAITGLTRLEDASDETDLINLGVYVADPDLADLVGTDRDSYKEDDIFPAVFAAEEAAGYVFDTYNVNVNTPYHLLCANVDALDRLEDGSLPETLYDEVRETHCIDNMSAIHDDATVAPDADYERVTVGADAEIEPNVSMDTTVVEAGAVVGAGATLENVIVAEDATVPPDTALTDTVVGVDAQDPFQMWHSFGGDG